MLVVEFNLLKFGFNADKLALKVLSLGFNRLISVGFTIVKLGGSRWYGDFDYALTASMR
tara:strand:+ start:16794 stop:16970 length:177 start_codon:yes stop_codon:yes gene_type:complete